MGNPPYDDDSYATKQTLVIHVDPRTTVDDGEVVARVQWFNKVKLLEAQAIVVSTLYDIATTTLQLYKDDGSIGAIVISTATVAQVLDASLADTVFETTNSLEIQLGNETATGLCDVILQYQNLFE